MDDFIFCGRALTEFRAHAFFGKSTTIAGAMTRSQYDVGGEELMDFDDAREETFPVSMTIIPMRGERATDEWQRRLIRWLRGARGYLSLMRTPDVCRLAQFDGEIRFTRASWPHGALELSATMSGGLYASREAEATFAVTQSGSGALYFSTGCARPARITIVPASSSVISGVTVTIGGHTVEIDGVEVSEALVIDQSAQRVSVTADGQSAFAQVTAWDQLMIESGAQIDVQIRYGSGGSAHVTAAARGRWTA